MRTALQPDMICGQHKRIYHWLTGEPKGISVLLLVEIKESLEEVAEGKVQGLGGEVSEHVGPVSSPQRDGSFLGNNTAEAVKRASVGGSKASRLEKLGLVLDKKLDSLDGGSDGLGNSGSDCAHASK
jgi:hypothetical protein